MDTFPFDYYVVVREVEALPEVLSATLRQWVEKIRETSRETSSIPPRHRLLAIL